MYFAVLPRGRCDYLVPAKWLSSEEHNFEVNFCSPRPCVLCPILILFFLPRLALRCSKTRSIQIVPTTVKCATADLVEFDINMSDDTLHLRSAFLLEQNNVSRPNFLVKAGDYSWKIHRHLFYHQNRDQNSIRDMGVSISSVSLRCQQLTLTQRHKKGTASIDFGPDEPWLVARLIQFLYTHTYDAPYIETCGPVFGLECSLETILQSHKRERPTTFAEDKEKDQDRSTLRTHFMMCELACLYDMPALVQHALHRALYDMQDSEAEEVLKAAAAIIGIHNVCRADELRKLFATFIADNRKHISEDMLRQWLRGDGTFAIEVVDCLTQRKIGTGQAGCRYGGSTQSQEEASVC